MDESVSVRVHDTLSGELVEVGRDGRVGIYVCGPTVYNDIHIGNARAPLFWDVVVRYLKSRDYEVTFVQNITDIEDKIIARANEEGVSWREIVDRYTESFHERLKDLGVARPDIEPRATEHIPEMIHLIEDLISTGHAYAPGNGDVYYAVESFPEYGALSRQRPEEMRETQKGQTGHKRSPLDFALWKASKPGEPSWESSWGPGRPGWHIECSAMVEKHLPGGADIHGGGTDLRFPHHENELAQSCAAHPGREFVRAWAHHGMVTLASDKMAKSVGNILDVERAVEQHGRNALRMWLLQSHYSQPIDYSEEILDEKRRAWERLQNMYIQVVGSTAASELDRSLVTELRQRFVAAMQDDFNTPEAIAAIFDVTGRAGETIAAHPDAMGNFTELENLLKELLGAILGFELPEQVQDTLLSEVEVIQVRYPAEVKPEEILNDLIAQRAKARRERDWETADQLREEIRAKGWEIEDTPGYTRIYPAKHIS